MTIKIKHKRSAVSGKAPLPADLDFGEIAVNYSASGPAIYVKDTAGAIRKIGSLTGALVFKGSKAPSDAAPGTPASGDLWVMSAAGKMAASWTGVAGLAVVKDETIAWDGSEWISLGVDPPTPDATETVKGTVRLADAAAITAGTAGRVVDAAQLKAAQAAASGSATAPAAPTAGQVWVDSSVTPAVIKVWSGTTWISQAGATVTSATAPAAPIAGQMWVDTSATPNVTKIWGGTKWVAATSDGAATATLANDAKYATKAELATENTWDRTGTVLSPATAGDVVNISAGTAALPGLTPVGDPDSGLFSPGADQVAVSTGGTGRVFVDSSGRVGIGTAKAAVPGLTIESAASTQGIELATDTGFAAGPTIRGYYRTGSSYRPLGISGSQVAFAIQDVEKARIDSSGRLLVGTSTATQNLRGEMSVAVVATGDNTSGGLGITGYCGTLGPAYPLLDIQRSRGVTDGSMTSLASGDVFGALTFRGADGTNFISGASIRGEADGTPNTDNMPGRLVFSTTLGGAKVPTERMRISNNGITQVYSSGVNSFISSNATAPDMTYKLFEGSHSATSTSTGTNCFIVFSNGTVQNTTNTYGSLSDIKLKENIIDASSQWDDLKALQVRNYNFKKETRQQTHTQIGLVAQEVELVSPGLVSKSPDLDDEGNDLGTVTKSVNYSVLYMKAVKALQEAMARIETLEAKVAALETPVY